MLKKSLTILMVIFLFFSLSTFSFSKGQGNLSQKKNTTITKKININTATIKELTSLKGIGEKIAKRIVEFRKKNGKFKRIDEIKAIRGIGEKKFERIKKFITVK